MVPQHASAHGAAANPHPMRVTFGLPARGAGQILTEEGQPSSRMPVPFRGILVGLLLSSILWIAIVFGIYSYI
ncbi:hypothetical protein LPC08_07630 [Roseomonas sp. OT10]|uniref:hypothetical protein n=1 Tax=Roseomonas cutis TaxID=2897332 RepID=UPI001E5EF00C|nr:hypothetical protein [Roseomonas sp. OT10]UFN50477.1 hypothetical protein LPC08_07630 [Roseomonas sp. OT10]